MGEEGGTSPASLRGAVCSRKEGECVGSGNETGESNAQGESGERVGRGRKGAARQFRSTVKLRGPFFFVQHLRFESLLPRHRRAEQRRKYEAEAERKRSEDKKNEVAKQARDMSSEAALRLSAAPEDHRRCPPKSGSVESRAGTTEAAEVGEKRKEKCRTTAADAGVALVARLRNKRSPKDSQGRGRVTTHLRTSINTNLPAPLLVHRAR